LLQLIQKIAKIIIIQRRQSLSFGVCRGTKCTQNRTFHLHALCLLDIFTYCPQSDILNNWHRFQIQNTLYPKTCTYLNAIHINLFTNPYRCLLNSSQAQGKLDSSKHGQASSQSLTPYIPSKVHSCENSWSMLKRTFGNLDVHGCDIIPTVQGPYLTR
jgi:hypothetical protein